MMEAIVERLGGIAPVSYDVARSTVGQWYRAGVTILAGTDANQAPSAPASPPYGTSLHHELELLVDAGMSAVDAVRSATIVAAQQFGLSDRGVIAAGKRADLVLIDGDPLRDISAVRKIAGVWCAGVPVADAPGLRPGTPGGRIPGAPRPGGVIVNAATAITNVRVFDGERLASQRPSWSKMPSRPARRPTVHVMPTLWTAAGALYCRG